MKKLLFLIFFPQILGAQNFEFETARSRENPGFFAIKIFASDSAQPLPVQNIFIKNFPKIDEKKFDKILPIVRDFGGKIIEKSEIKKFAVDPRNRFFLLGPPHENFPNFAPKNSEKILDEFENFLQKFGGPVFFRDLRLNFGGNISEVFPEKINFFGENPQIFVGKFEQPQKTRVEIRATGRDGEVFATAALDLNDENLITENNLSEIWENFFRAENFPPPQNSILQKKLENFFPIILGAAGLLLVFLAIFKKKSARKNAENFLEIENIPFEISPEKNREKCCSGAEKIE